MKPTFEREWFSVKSAAKYSDFSTRTIETAIHLGKLKSLSVHLQGKREWLEAWIEGKPANETSRPLAQQIACEVVRLLRCSPLSPS